MSKGMLCMRRASVIRGDHHITNEWFSSRHCLLAHQWQCAPAPSKCGACIEWHAAPVPTTLARLRALTSQSRSNSDASSVPCQSGASRLALHCMGSASTQYRNASLCSPRPPRWCDCSWKKNQTALLQIQESISSFKILLVPSLCWPCMAPLWCCAPRTP